MSDPDPFCKASADDLRWGARRNPGASCNLQRLGCPPPDRFLISGDAKTEATARVMHRGRPFPDLTFRTMNGQLQNRILMRLNEHDAGEVIARCERISLPRSSLLAEPGAMMEFAYFPVGCVLSSIVILDNGTSVETATAGNEGMVYVGLTAQQHSSPFRIITQIAGGCLRIRADALERSLRELPQLQALLHRYCLSLLLQTSQNAACNLRHTVEQRMARWLLVCGDRSGNEELDLTQEFLSLMLGVRRQSVNVTAGLLQRKGLIAYRRGGIKVLDRAGLEATACECYGVTSRLYDQVMGGGTEPAAASPVMAGH